MDSTRFWPIYRENYLKYKSMLHLEKEKVWNFFVVGKPVNVYISGYYILTDDEYDSNTEQPEVKLERPFMTEKAGNADTSNWQNLINYSVYV